MILQFELYDQLSLIINLKLFGFDDELFENLLDYLDISINEWKKKC